MKNQYKLNISKYSTHNIIINSVKKNSRVLDLGCNDGYIGKLADKSNEFYGVDYSKNSIEVAKEYYKDVLRSDLNIINPLPWNLKFDVIIFADVLEHLLEPEKVLNFYVENYLENDGCVIISLPNIANWQIRKNLLFGSFEYRDTGIMDRTHLHFYTFKSAIELTEKNNLKAIEILGGASFFGSVIKALPFLRNILATNIILVCKKNHE